MQAPPSRAQRSRQAGLSRILKNHNNMSEEELQPKGNQWGPDDEGAKKGELNPKRVSGQEFAYAIDQLKIPNCYSPLRLAGGFIGQMAGYGKHTVPSSKF